MANLLVANIRSNSLVTYSAIYLGSLKRLHTQILSFNESGFGKLDAFKGKRTVPAASYEGERIDEGGRLSKVGEFRRDRPSERMVLDPGKLAAEKSFYIRALSAFYEKKSEATTLYREILEAPEKDVAGIMKNSEKLRSLMLSLDSCTPERLAAEYRANSLFAAMLENGISIRHLEKLSGFAAAILPYGFSLLAEKLPTVTGEYEVKLSLPGKNEPETVGNMKKATKSFSDVVAAAKADAPTESGVPTELPSQITRIDELATSVQSIILVEGWDYSLRIGHQYSEGENDFQYHMRNIMTNAGMDFEAFWADSHEPITNGSKRGPYAAFNFLSVRGEGRQEPMVKVNLVYPGDKKNPDAISEITLQAGRLDVMLPGEHWQLNLEKFYQMTF